MTYEDHINEVAKATREADQAWSAVSEAERVHDAALTHLKEANNALKAFNQEQISKAYMTTEDPCPTSVAKN